MLFASTEDGSPRMHVSDLRLVMQSERICVRRALEIVIQRPASGIACSLVARFRRLLRFLLALALVACVLRTSATAQTGATTDRAGVTVHTIDLSRPQARIELRQPAQTVLGSGNDDRAFLLGVVGVVRLSDGTFVVANSGTAELKLFDARGRYRQSAGRKGRGPGEFEQLGYVTTLANDSILAADAMLRRISVFDRSGRHARTTSLEVPQGRRAPRVVSAVRGRWLIVATPDIETAPARPEPYHFTQELFLYDLEGRPVRALGRFPEAERFVQPVSPQHPQRGNSYWSLAFGRSTAITGFDEVFAIAEGTAVEVKLFDARGALRAMIRSPYNTPVVTAQDREAFGREALAGADRSPMRAMIERMVEEMPYPARFPAVQNVMADAAGRLWIKRYQRPSERAETWWVVTRQGQFVGEATLPPGARLRAVGETSLITLERDQDDVELVREYRFRVAPSR